jgi:hypothetical protein
MNDPLDVSLVDTILLIELELTTELMIAATPSDRHLSQDEIDVLLGLAPRVAIPRLRPTRSQQASVAPRPAHQ